MTEELSIALFKRTDTDTIEREVRAERQRHLAKWGPQTHANGTSFDLWTYETEKAKNDWQRSRETGSETWLQILHEEVLEVFEKEEDDLLGMREELIQVMAVAKAWIVDIDNKLDAEAEAQWEEHGLVLDD